MSDYKIRTDDHMSPMGDPVAFFITWATYGTWLPGDERGWTEYHHGWQLPKLPLALECTARMSEASCVLSPAERVIVEKQIAQTCSFRGWILHAVNCRSNHLHVVVATGDARPKKIRRDLKAWCARRLKEFAAHNRQHWWAERGSIRWIWNTMSLATVIEYATDGQDRKCHEYP